MSWANALFLNDGEQSIHAWKGIYFKPYTKSVEQARLISRRAKYRQEVKTEPKSGVLVLTTRRLAWLEKRGLIGKSFHLTFDIPLSALKGTSMGGKIQKHVTITGADGENKFRLKGVGGKEFEAFKDMIMRQAEKQRQERSATQPVAKEVVTREVVMIPCQYCGGLMPQTSTFCPSCGAQRKG